MGKSKRLKKRLQAFVDGLTPTEAKEQLVLAYLQMEKCINVLRGHDVEPVEMLDNGESSDLELFYRCKKVRKELDMAEKENALHDINDQIDSYEREYSRMHEKPESNPASAGVMKYKIEFDTSGVDEKLRGIKESLREIDALYCKVSGLFK